MQKKYNALDFKRNTCKKLKWDCKLTVKLHSLHQGHSFIFFFRIWDIITVINSQYIKGAWVYIYFFFHFTERSPCSNKRSFYCLRNLKIFVGHVCFVCLFAHPSAWKNTKKQRPPGNNKQLLILQSKAIFKPKQMKINARYGYKENTDL